MSIDTLLTLVEQYKDSKSIKTVAQDLYAQYSKTVTGQRLTIN